MKTFSLYTLVVDGHHASIDEAKAALYPKEYVHEWQFTGKSPKVIDVLAVDTAVNQMAGLYRADGRTNPEAFQLARAALMLGQCLTEWNYKSETGELLPITKENIETLPHDVCVYAAERLEFTRIPSPEELEKKLTSLSNSLTGTDTAAA